MKRQADLERRLRALRTLGDAVGALKGLSAHHFREAREAVAPARSYREGVERILGWAGARLPESSGPGCLLVIGGELGLCGAYNARIVEAGAERRRELGPGPTLCVGRRAATLLGRRGVQVDEVYGGPTGVRGITALLLRLAEDLLAGYAMGRLSSAEILSCRFAGVGVAAPASVRLLPVEPGVQAPGPPIRYVDRARFASAAVREHLYATLHGLLVDALASEHGARLVATQSAERWLDERAERLRRHLAAARREAATQEVIETATGARARRHGVRRRAGAPRPGG